MRKVTYGVACSLDGYIAGRDGGIDWIHFGSDSAQIMKSYWETIDTILMGRKTYSDAAERGDGGGSFPGVTIYLFSRTLTQTPDPSVRLVTEDAVRAVRDLKQETGKGIFVMSGGDFARTLFDAELIDEVSVNIHPVMLGAGVPLLQDPGFEIQLELRETQTLDGGCLYATYAVKRRNP